jgi:hypothetical protein
LRVPVDDRGDRHASGEFYRSERANLVFVELGRVRNSTAAEWIGGVRAGSDMPLIAAVNPDPDPPVMIETVRGGVNECLCLPVASGFLRRAGTDDDAAGGAKAGGMGPGKNGGAGKVLLADPDPQSSAAHRVVLADPGRNLNPAVWAFLRGYDRARLPDDQSGLEKLPRDRIEFPAGAPFGRAITKLAGTLTKPAGKDAGRKTP